MEVCIKLVTWNKSKTELRLWSFERGMLYELLGIIQIICRPSAVIYSVRRMLLSR